MSRFEFEVIRDKLSKEEESILNQWGENAKKTTLPLLRQAEARQIAIPNPEHENPIITIEPLGKDH